MNSQLKTVLLTVLTLSAVTIALVELSGVSATALFNKYGIGSEQQHDHTHDEGLEDRNALQEKVQAMPKTSITFEEDKFNFGTIKEGEVVRHTYKFTNTGSNPLLISDAIASCGCTVPSFPKTPVMPGNQGEILVEFNSKGRKGKNNKSVIIVSNADREKVSVSFEVEVE